MRIGIPGGTVTVHALDKIFWESLCFPLTVCFPIPYTLSSFLSALTYNYHIHILLSLCATATEFHFPKFKSGVCSNDRRFFGFGLVLLVFNAEPSA